MISNIQVARGFAAICVIIFHIIGTSRSYSQGVEWLLFIEGWGAFGVDLFFVISGFVMVKSLNSRHRDPLEFFVLRFARIVPLYWMITALVILFYILFPQVFRSTNITLKWAASSFSFLSNFLYSKNPVIMVGWTLEYEMLFYVILTLALKIGGRRSGVPIASVVLFVVAIVFNNTLLNEFNLGILAGVCCRYKLFSEAKYWFLLMLGVVVILIGARGVEIFPKITRFWIWGLPSFCIVVGASNIGQVKTGWLTKIGEASYSIYLIQVIAIPCFYKLSSKHFVGMNADLVAMICLAINVIIGLVVHRTIERPLNSAVKKWMFNKCFARNSVH
jgi:exopolysaccharide production protein ExoZ